MPRETFSTMLSAFRRAPQPPTPLRSRALVILPLYVACLLVLIAGVSAVNSIFDDPKLATTTTALCVLGTAVSYVLRVVGVQQRVITLASVIAVAVFMANARNIVSGAFAYLSQHDVDPASAGALGLLLEWATVAFSFTMVTNQSVLFAVVPSMALLGLMSSENLNPEMVTYFLAFVLATVFLMGYDRCLSRTGEEDSSVVKPTVRSLVAVSAVIVAGSAVLGALVASPLRAAGKTVLSTAAERLTDAGLVLIQPLVGPGSEILSLAGTTPSFTGRVVMKVRSPEPLYWRAQSFGYYNGTEWHVGGGLFDAARQGRRVVPRGQERAARFTIDAELVEEQAGSARRKVVQEYEVDSSLSGPICAASVPVEVIGPFDEVVADAHLDLVGGASRPVTKYTVVSLVSTATPDDLRSAFDGLTDEELFQYQSRVWIPRAPPRVVELVQDIVAGSPTPYDQVLRIQNYLREHCRYTLDPPLLPPDADATEFFLFRSRSGYCEQFASAMAVMCRLIGLRSRVAVGYATGTWDSKERRWIVRDEDAHAWVEVEFPGYGWIPFDPTAGAEVEKPALFSLRRLTAQLIGLITSRRLMPTLMVVLLAGTMLYAVGTFVSPRSIVRRLRNLRLWPYMAFRRDARAELMRQYRSLCRALAGRSGMPKRSETPHEFLRRVLSHADDEVAAAATTVIEAYVLAAYGGVEPDLDAVDRIRSNVRTVVAAVRRRRGRAALGGIPNG